MTEKNTFLIIILDNLNALFGIVSGNAAAIVNKIDLKMPKYDRNKMSALQYARKRLDQRHKNLKQVADLCKAIIGVNNNVNGIFLIGIDQSDLSDCLYELLSTKAKKMVLNTYTIDHWDFLIPEFGLNKAIELTINDRLEFTNKNK